MKPPKKFQAATRQMTRDDYDEEPNMKLSSAFLVVLALHLVAIGGMFTFSRIKSQQHAPPLDTYQAAPAAVAPAPAAAVETPAPKPVEDGNVYTVASGDTLAAIARKFHVTSQSLLKLNKIDDPKKLQIGQKLKLPPRKPKTD